MGKFTRVICILTVLCSLTVCNGIYAAEDNLNKSLEYMGYKDYKDENPYDISLTNRGYIDFEDGALNIYAGKKDKSGSVNGTSVNLDLTYTNVRVKIYPYLAIRIKTEKPETGGNVTCYAGEKKCL